MQDPKLAKTNYVADLVTRWDCVGVSNQETHCVNSLYYNNFVVKFIKKVLSSIKGSRVNSFKLSFHNHTNYVNLVPNKLKGFNQGMKVRPKIELASLLTSIVG